MHSVIFSSRQSAKDISWCIFSLPIPSLCMSRPCNPHWCKCWQRSSCSHKSSGLEQTHYFSQLVIVSVVTVQKCSKLSRRSRRQQTQTTYNNQSADEQMKSQSARWNIKGSVRRFEIEIKIKTVLCKCWQTTSKITHRFGLNSSDVCQVIDADNSLIMPLLSRRRRL